MAWVPVADSGLEFEFIAGDEVTWTGSTVTSDPVPGDQDSYWGLYFPLDAGPRRFRITNSGDYRLYGVAGDKAWIYWLAEIVNFTTEGTQNAAADPLTAWSPQQIEVEAAYASLRYGLTIGTAPSKYTFLVEVWVDDPEPELETEVFVYTMTRIGQVGAWSRYVFPFAIEDWAIAGDTLYLRSGDFIHRVDASVVGDEVGRWADGWEFEIVPFVGVVQWAWLDLGQPGVTKTLYGFDIVGEGAVSVSFGIDQSNGGLFTPGFSVPADTVPGMVIPMPLAAPSLSVKLTYDGSTNWQWNALQLYLQDTRGMT